MTFKRKIYDKLLAWKNSPVRNSALLIEGARRIGKSTIVEEFGKNEYEDFLLLDFMYATKEIKDLFLNLNNLDLFFSNLFLLTGKVLKKGGLIIFDEVQFCPTARQAIKLLVKDGRYDYIETGSLLSIRDNTENISIPSEERRIEMYPMDYEEFLWAFGKKNIADTLRIFYNEKKEIQNSVHEELLKNYRLYLALGGMPKVISIFQTTNSFLEAELEKQDIIKLYRDDLLKHDSRYKTVCRMLYNNLANELNNTNSRFNVSKVFENKRASQLEESLFDLMDSKICNVCYRSTDPTYGLELSKNESFFKLYGNDIGLTTSLVFSEMGLNPDAIYKLIMFDKLNGNFGKIFESAVCQGLTSLGIVPYYHTYQLKGENDETKFYEIDFIIQLHGNVTAIEVKSGQNFTTSSLDRLSIKYNSLKFRKIIISTKSFKYKNDILFLPIYMLFCLE